MIYVDNAATTKVSQAAIEAMLPFFDQAYGNPSSHHAAGQEAAQALLNARKTMAALIGSRPDEIYFTSGGSESDNQALLSAAALGRQQGKKHIISTAIEHHAVLHTLQKLEKNGFEITLLDVHENGIVRPKELEQSIRPETALVTVMFANNEIGTIQPICEIGTICRERGVLFHTDAVQAAGHIAINVEKHNIDLLSLSAHKFNGPKGVGVLYAKSGVRLERLIEGGAQEHGKRAGTENGPAIVGMAAAFQESAGKISESTSKVTAMRDTLLNGLLAIPHTVLNGDRSSRLPGNVNVSFEGIDGESLLILLNEKGICASSGSACTSGSDAPSHVLLAIGRPPETARGALRISLSDENTPQEIEYIIRTVTESVQYLREMSPFWKK